MFKNYVVGMPARSFQIGDLVKIFYLSELYVVCDIIDSETLLVYSLKPPHEKIKMFSHLFDKVE
jgi:hypothetical protein